MGQFKPMVKMKTTEPSVILKLKKGGHVAMPKMKAEKKASGGALSALATTPAFVGRPAVNAPVRSPGKPSMAARRKAMAPVMKKGGDVESKLKAHEAKPASKAHAGLKTGGVVKGAGGFKTGGVIKGQGGFKKGGAAKKYADGGMVDTGAPVKMPKKKPSAPVSTNRKAGTFAEGGQVSNYERAQVNRAGVLPMTAAEEKKLRDTYGDIKQQQMENQGAANFQKNLRLKKKGGAC